MDADSDFFVLTAIETGSSVVYQCPLDYDDHSLLDGTFRPVSPIPLEWYKGHRYLDVIRFWDVCNFCISEKFQEKLIKASATGWRTYPVELNNTDKKYYGFQVSARVGPILSRGKPKGEIVQGLDFDKSAWRGEDFFMPADSVHIVCTRRIKQAVERKINNVRFIKLEDCDYYNPLRQTTTRRTCDRRQKARPKKPEFGS